MNNVIVGDSANELKNIESESIDLIVTDPPYGYSFMGKDWDRAVPSVDIWKECLRVLKPGAFAFIMSAPRLDVLTQMSVRVQEAGFDVAFTPLYWAYASGFPKATNMSKAVDKRLGAEREITGRNNNYRPISGTSGYLGETTFRQTENMRYEKDIPASPQANTLNGSYGGFQPKPAVEVIIVAMKPLSEKTYIDQALANGKGITWLDDGRIPHGGEIEMGNWDRFKGYQSPDAIRKNFEDRKKDNFTDRIDNGINESGRFPANLLVSDDVLDDGKNHVGTGGLKPQRPSPDWSPFHEENNRPYFNYGDSGGFSRYFSLDKWAEQLPFLIVPKASKSEKNKGLDGLPLKQNIGGGGTYNAECANKFGSVDSPSQNFHPTVKPLKLMSYLISIGSRPGDLVMDPFAGSGTTLLAAKNLNRDYIGIELNPEYATIINARLGESFNGGYSNELIRQPRPQRTIFDFAG